MKKKETSNMHYVPQCYLKKFSDDNESIFGLRKKNNEIFSDKMENLCAKNGFYSMNGETEYERQIIENFYKKNFEDNYNETYNLLINPQVEIVTQEQRQQIIAFIISLYFRNLNWYQNSKKFIESKIEYSYNLVQQNPILKKIHWDENTIIDFEKLTLQEAKKMLYEKSRQTIIVQQIASFDKMIKLRYDNDIIVRRINTDYEYITSDSPSVMHDFDNNFIESFNLKNVMYLTLDSKHSVKLCPQESKYFSNKIIRFNESGISALSSILINNDDMFNSSTHYVLGTQRGIEKFREVRIKYTRAFLRE